MIDLGPTSELQQEERSFQLERLKFHWSVWQDAVKNFNRTSLGSFVLMALLVLLSIQTSGKISILGSSWDVGKFSLQNLRLLRLFLLLAGILVSVRVADLWIDLQRHRVPEDLRESLHNDFVGKLNFRKIGRWAQSISLAIAIGIDGAAVICLAYQFLNTQKK